MAAGRRLEKFWVVISPKWVIQSTSYLVLWWGFLDWRSDWHHLHFDQIQDDAHGRHMCHKVLQYLKNSSSMNATQYCSRFTGSHHEYALSEASAVVHSTIWLHLDTFRLMEHDLPQTKRLLNTWKNCFAIKASQHSGHLYWIKSWIHTFGAHLSG